MADSATNFEGNEADTEDVEDVDADSMCYRVPKDSMQMVKTVHITAAYASLPKSKKRLVKALKKIQVECTKLEASFYQEVHQLECKYAALYAPLYEKRNQIVNGMIEPTDEDCYFPSDVESDDEFCEDMVARLNINPQGDIALLKGIPHFWLTAMRNIDMIGEMIQPYDEPILECLSDIKVILFESDPVGFRLEFHFEPNEYFNNSVLHKTYEMKCVVEDNDPFSFDGPEIYKCEGCDIDWKPDKAVNVKTIVKKQKHKNSGSIRLIRKTMIADSFFNFFNPPIPNQDSNSKEVEEAIPDILSADFEIGHFIRERFVPRAVLFYTGEATDIEDIGCDVEDEDEEIEIEEEDVD